MTCPTARPPRPRLLAAAASLTALMGPGPDTGAAELLVGPGESIQAAIDDPATVDGDVITVSAGTYVETIDFLGKAITLRSADGPATTIIDGGGAGPVVSCVSDEDLDTVLEGFTITGGDAVQGGGMDNLAASPTIRGCLFVGNSADLYGGGMYNDGGSPLVVDCRFVGNTARFGGGMCNIQARPTVINGLFNGNVAGASSSGHGGGIGNLVFSRPLILNCTLSGNDAGTGGGLSCSFSNATVANSVVWGNSATGSGPEVRWINGAAPVYSNCDIGGSGGSAAWDDALGLDGGGNLDTDPMFVSHSGQDGVSGTLDDDLRLQPGSPVIDAGDSVLLPPDILTDLDGAERLVDDPDTPDTGLGAVVVDIGAYEWQEADAVVALPLDLRPRRCPNVVRRFGSLWAAINGTDEIAAEAIDPETIVLRRADGVGEPVAPCRVHERLRDVGAASATGGCGCEERHRDGRADLVLRFRSSHVFEALQLETLDSGSEIEIVVEGTLCDGTPFTSSDCATIGRVRRWNPVARPVHPWSEIRRRILRWKAARGRHKGS